MTIVDDQSRSPIFDYSVEPTSRAAKDGLFTIAIANGQIRRRVADSLTGAMFDILVAQQALVSPRAKIGTGTIICDQAIVEAGATIGRHFHANIFSYVAHDCIIGDFVTFAPRVSCNGNVHIGDMVTIGTGVLIRQGSQNAPLRIGDGAVIQMGAIITRDVQPHALVKANSVH